MKNMLTKLAILGTTICLVSCSTNTRNENTAVGAVGGGVVGGLAGGALSSNPAGIAAGVVVGALIGGFVGHQMKSADHTQMNNAMDQPIHHKTAWKNGDTGTRYTLTPTSKVMVINGVQNCRTYTSTIVMTDGTKHRFNGAACRQTDGSWKKVTT